MSLVLRSQGMHMYKDNRLVFNNYMYDTKLGDKSIHAWSNMSNIQYMSNIQFEHLLDYLPA